MRERDGKKVVGNTDERDKKLVRHKKKLKQCYMW